MHSLVIRGQPNKTISLYFSSFLFASDVLAPPVAKVLFQLRILIAVNN